MAFRDGLGRTPSAGGLPPSLERAKKVEKLGERFQCYECGKRASVPGSTWNNNVDGNENLDHDDWDEPGDLYWCSRHRHYYCSDHRHSCDRESNRKKFLGIF